MTLSQQINYVFLVLFISSSTVSCNPHENTSLADLTPADLLSQFTNYLGELIRTPDKVTSQAHEMAGLTEQEILHRTTHCCAPDIAAILLTEFAKRHKLCITSSLHHGLAEELCKEPQKACDLYVLEQHWAQDEQIIKQTLIECMTPNNNNSDSLAK